MTEQALRRFPNHAGLIHYYIHIMELSPDFALALPYVSRLLKEAGGVSHIQHMPGHLYFLQGQYRQAADTFEKAGQTDEAYHRKQRIPFLNNDNYLHNLHYLAVALAEAGQRENALRAAHQYAQALPASGRSRAGRSRASGMLMIQYEGLVMPALVHMRFGEWQEAADYLTSCVSDNANAMLFRDGLLAYCLAMKKLLQPQPPPVLTLVNTIESAQQGLYAQQQNKAHTPEFERIKRALQILTVLQAELGGWVANLDTSQPLDQRAFFEALRLEKDIGYQEPPRLVSPVFERIGDFFLHRQDAPNALQVYRKALEKRPHSPVILAKIKALPNQ